MLVPIYFLSWLIDTTLLVNWHHFGCFIDMICMLVDFKLRLLSFFWYLAGSNGRSEGVQHFLHGLVEADS